MGRYQKFGFSGSFRNGPANTITRGHKSILRNYDSHREGQATLITIEATRGFYQAVPVVGSKIRGLRNPGIGSMDVVVFLAMPICCWTPELLVTWLKKLADHRGIRKKWLKQTSYTLYIYIIYTAPAKKTDMIWNLVSTAASNHLGATILVANSFIKRWTECSTWTWSLPSSRNQRAQRGHGPGQFQGGSFGKTHSDDPTFASSLRDPLSIWAQPQNWWVGILDITSFAVPVVP